MLKVPRPFFSNPVVFLFLSWWNFKLAEASVVSYRPPWLQAKGFHSHPYIVSVFTSLLLSLHLHSFYFLFAQFLKYYKLAPSFPHGWHLLHFKCECVKTPFRETITKNADILAPSFLFMIIFMKYLMHIMKCYFKNYIAYS